MKKDFCRYDMHIHTRYSRCSNLSPEAILKESIKKKLDGIAVVDHDSIKGSLEVAKLNKSKDFEVIVGEEVSTNMGHVLVYYVNKEIKARDINEVIDEAKKQEAITCIAHPYALLRNQLKLDKNIIKNIRCIETFNGRNNFNFENKKADLLANKFNKAKIGGSDAHFRQEIGAGITQFRNNFREAVKKKQTSVLGNTNLLKSLAMESASTVLKVFHKVR